MPKLSPPRSPFFCLKRPFEVNDRGCFSHFHSSRSGLKIFIENGPEDLDPIFKCWIDLDLMTNKPQEAGFFLSFAQTAEEIKVNDDEIQVFVENEEIFWMAYPKGYFKEIQGRHQPRQGLGVLGKFGLEVV